MEGREDRETDNPFEMDAVSDDEENEVRNEDDVICPVIKLTKEDKKWLRGLWKQTLIIKVMGRKVGYAYLLRRIIALWKPKGRMELVALENDYFLVKFGSMDDYKYAKFLAASCVRVAAGILLAV